ncbi:MAG TPA: hypothetical protein PLQ34_09495 [Ferrovaceae bacterium]|nr:hypothetical protein [Ferrovaceae bacterium]
MPSKSDKQHRLMEAVAHNKAFAKKAGRSYPNLVDNMHVARKK